MTEQAKYFGGIDWASRKHDLCVIDEQGQVVARLVVPHTAEGLSELLRRLRRFPAVEVAIERPSGLLVDTLLEAGTCVVPIHPNQLKASRPRYSAAQGKSDRGDAYMLADLLRTDGHRFRILQSPSDRTRAMRVAIRTRNDLVKTRVQLLNQLRSLLEGFWMGPIGLFHRLDSHISLAFLARYPTPGHAAHLGEKRLTTFLQRNGYCGRKSPADLLERIRAAAPGQAGDVENATRGKLVKSLVAVLRTTKEQIGQIERLVADGLQAHPDGEWLRSFPQIGITNAAQILAELGDERTRYRSAQQLAAEAGVVPITRASGRHRAVVFRYACNKRLRKALTTWANNSRRDSPWAQEVYRKARERGCRHPHAVRILARAWIRVLWRCWKDQAPYDPAKHTGTRRFCPPESPSSMAA
jgi:transposase